MPRPATPRRRPSDGRPLALASWELNKKAAAAPHTAPVPSTLIMSPRNQINPGHSSGVVSPNMRRTDSSQVVVPEAENTNTPIPEGYLVMFCHRCYRFGCDRHQPGQTDTNTRCPSCQYSPLEVPTTPKGLLTCHGIAARQHGADARFTGALQALMSLQFYTRGRMVLFPSDLSTSQAGRTGNADKSGARSFLDDAHARREVTYTFKCFAPDSPKADAKCVVRLMPCAAERRLIV